MGFLYKTDLDTIQLNFLKESAYLRGTSVIFYETLSEEKNIYTDMEVQSMTTGTPVDIIFETYPQNRKTLQREGWYNKDAEDNPATAFVPFDLSILKRWQRVLIPGQINDNPSLYRTYEVTKISTTMDHPHYYLIALAPVFTDTSPAIDRNQNNTYIEFNDITGY